MSVAGYAGEYKQPVVRIVTRPSMWGADEKHGFYRLFQQGNPAAFYVGDNSFTTRDAVDKTLRQHNAEMHEMERMVAGFIERASESKGPDELFTEVMDFLQLWDTVWGKQRRSENAGSKG